MPTNSKTKKPSKKASQKWHVRAAQKIRAIVDERLAENPHRTFRLTRRRDYVRSLNLPHPLLFILEVTQTLWRYKRHFLWLMLIYIVFYVLLVGIGTQDLYEELTAALQETESSQIAEALGAFAQTGLTAFAVISEGITGELTESQQIFAVLLGLLVWLTTVWLLRNLMAGHKVKLRDALYNAGAPLVPTAVIAFVIILQALPVILASIGYAAATSSGLLSGGGVAAMLFWIAAGLLTVLSLYWMTSSFFAMIIVTLPGVYPMTALKSARQLLLGRRVRFLIRFVWMAAFVSAVWVIGLILTIALDNGLKALWPQIGWLPLVPAMVLILSTFSVFWVSAYIYLLYRKVVDNESN